MATNKKRITVSLTEDQYSTLEKLAKEKGFSKSAILALALEDYSRKELEQKKLLKPSPYLLWRMMILMIGRVLMN